MFTIVASSATISWATAITTSAASVCRGRWSGWTPGRVWASW